MLTPEAVANFLCDRLGADPADVELQAPLFSSGLVDSQGMVELIMFIENEANVQLDSSDVTLENFDSIESILMFVKRVSAQS